VSYECVGVGVGVGVWVDGCGWVGRWVVVGGWGYGCGDRHGDIEGICCTVPACTRAPCLRGTRESCH